MMQFGAYKVCFFLDRRMVPLPNDLKTERLIVDLSFNTSGPTVSLPPGASDSLLASCTWSKAPELGSYLNYHLAALPVSLSQP